MLTPGLADLLKPVVVVSATTHSVNILRNKGMDVVRQGKPIHVDRPFVTGVVVVLQGNPVLVDRPFVTGVSSQRDASEAHNCATVELLQPNQLADDDVR